MRYRFGAIHIRRYERGDDLRVGGSRHVLREESIARGADIGLASFDVERCFRPGGFFLRDELKAAFLPAVHSGYRGFPATCAVGSLGAEGACLLFLLMIVLLGFPLA